MGKGPRPDTPRPPRAPVTVTDAPPSDDPCASIVLDFRPLSEAMVGAAVVLVRDGAALVLVSGGVRVGVPSVAAVDALRRCLGRWQYAGRITSVGGDCGTATLAGTRLA